MNNPIETTKDAALARADGGRPCMVCWDFEPPVTAPVDPSDTDWQNSPGNRAAWTSTRTSQVIHRYPGCSDMNNPVLTTIELALAREDSGRPCMLCWTNQNEHVPPPSDADWQTAPGNRTVWVSGQANEIIHSYAHCSNMANPIETTIDAARARQSGGRPCMICWQNMGDPEPPVQTNDWLNSTGNRSVWVASQAGEVIHSSPYSSNMVNPIEITIDAALAREGGGRPCMMCWDNRGEQ